MDFVRGRLVRSRAGRDSGRTLAVLAVEGQKPISYLGHAGGVMPTVEEMVDVAKKALKEVK